MDREKEKTRERVTERERAGNRYFRDGLPPVQRRRRRIHVANTILRALAVGQIIWREARYPRIAELPESSNLYRERERVSPVSPCWTPGDATKAAIFTVCGRTSRTKASPAPYPCPLLIDGHAARKTRVNPGPSPSPAFPDTASDFRYYRESRSHLTPPRLSLRLSEQSEIFLRDFIFFA